MCLFLYPSPVVHRPMRRVSESSRPCLEGARRGDWRPLKDTQHLGKRSHPRPKHHRPDRFASPRHNHNTNTAQHHCTQQHIRSLDRFTGLVLHRKIASSRSLRQSPPTRSHRAAGPATTTHTTKHAPLIIMKGMPCQRARLSLPPC